MVILVLGALGYGAMVVLATFVEPEQREMRVLVPSDRYDR
jgi:hypothetical protein